MIRFEAREPRGRASHVIASVLVAACAIGGGVLAVVATAVFAGRGLPLPEAGALASGTILNEIPARAAPLILTGLAASLAFRIRFYNFGGEGQFLAGAFAALAIAASPAPAWVLLMTALVAGALAGTCVAIVPAALRIGRNADEAIVSLLMNFVMLLSVQMALSSGAPGKWAAGMARLVERVGVSTGVVVALAAAIGIGALLRFTVGGFQIRAVAGNPDAARYAGIPIDRLTFRVALASGALAGLGGAVAAAGGQFLPAQQPYAGIGYAGIAVALLAGRSEPGVVGVAVLFAAVLALAQALAGSGATPAPELTVFVAVALTLGLAGAGLVRYRVIPARRSAAS